MNIGRNLRKDLQFLLKAFLNPKRKRCFYIGYTGYGNLGDEALREAIFELFQEKIVFSEAQGMLVRFFKKLGLIHFDVLMIGGGTLLMRSQLTLDAVKRAKIDRSFVFGTGVANYHFWKNIKGNYGSLKDWSNFLLSCRYVGVRGPVSKALLDENSVPCEIIGDPVLYFTRDLKDKKKKQKSIGVNIAKISDSAVWGADENILFGKISRFVKMLFEQGWKIEFIPMTDIDLLAINKVKEMAQLPHLAVFKQYHSVEKTINKLEEFDVFIGEKLHSVVLAYCANTPSVMLEYRPKCFDFMKSIGMEEFNIRVDQFEEQLAVDKLQKLYTNLEDVRKNANQACIEYKKKLIKAAEKSFQQVFA